MAKEKLARLAPGRLTGLISEGLRGHHLLFERAAILTAFRSAEAPAEREEASAVGQALLTICREPLPVARAVVEALPEPALSSLIRLYFRLLDRVNQDQPLRH